MIITDKWKAPASGRLYTVTDKESPDTGEDFEGKKYASWMLAGQIRDRFKDEPVTMQDIYYEVGVPLRLSSSNIIVLVKGAVKEGYLR